MGPSIKFVTLPREGRRKEGGFEEEGWKEERQEVLCDERKRSDLYDATSPIGTLLAGYCRQRLAIDGMEP